jgi:hypothetical protein
MLQHHIGDSSCARTIVIKSIIAALQRKSPSYALFSYNEISNKHITDVSVAMSASNTEPMGSSASLEDRYFSVPVCKQAQASEITVPSPLPVLTFALTFANVKVPRVVCTRVCCGSVGIAD